LPLARPSQLPVGGADKDDGDVPRYTSPVLDVVGKGGGQPLDPKTRADMEARLGSDFADVRIHTGDKAAKSAAAVSATAYTVGNDVVFSRGFFDPTSHQGRHRLAHELVHVQQQRQGPVPSTDSGDGVAVSDPADSFEREAEAMAARAVSGPQRASQDDVRDYHRSGSSIQFTGGRSVQRCGGVPCDCAADEKASVQRDSADAPGQAQRKGGAVSAGAGAAPGNLTGGHALAPSLRAPLERSLGHDFSDVRVHSNSAAAQAAAAVNARAYTLGRDVVFGAGQYAPETSAGMHLLVHELMHFTQQGQGAPKMVMRAAGDAAGTTPQPPFMGANFSFRPDDPPCSAAPRGLGQIASEVDCPVATEDIGFQGHHFHFCVGSDVFAAPKTPTELLNFVRRQPAASRFKVHGYASTIGDPADNDRLSCHRALRVAREMINDGVPAENIDVARHGQTDEFPGGPDFNQVAVVLPVPPPPVSGPAENLPFDTHDQKLAIVEGAREGLRAGTYNLGADAYISFWTCGKIKTVSDAVDRMHVRFEGDPGLPKVDEGGQAEGLGTNVIAVSQATLAAVNQNACITERLVDMAFHQMTLGTIGTQLSPDRAFDLRHQGARYLAALGGFEACNSPGTPVPLPADDPLGFEAAPGCAETPLATRLDTTRKAPAPSFSATSQWQVSSGQIGWKIDSEANRALMTVPAFPIAAQANVQATGDPKSFPDFELGYMQTVTDDSTVVNYVSGHTLEIRVPTPIRDRERNPSRAPFFSSDFVSTPDVSGHASARMFKVTATEVPLVYEDVESGGRRQASNVIDTITREAHFVTWLVARRRGAPPDRFDTHFLAGQEFDFTMNVDVLNLDGSGKFANTKSDPSSGSDAVMQFGGPTPEDLGPSELTIVTNPPSRESAAQITRAEFAGILRNISESLQPPELGLKHSKLTLTIFLDADTGRVALPEPDKNFLPFEVTSPNVPSKPRFELGHEVFIRARKRDFLGSPDKAVIVKKDPRDHTSSKHEPVSIDLDPSPNEFLPDRLGVKGAMNFLWQLTEADEQKDHPRGWVLTVYIDRNDQLRPFLPRQGDKPTFERGPSGGLIVKFREFCGGTAADPDNDTPLGTIHTHPNPLGQVLDEDAPSKEDHDNARDSQSLCGVQFFMIDNDTVFEYDADSDHPLGTRKSFLP
jgi:outer membrane protein OmpA-like peptidoglycan-associated protein